VIILQENSNLLIESKVKAICAEKAICNDRLDDNELWDLIEDTLDEYSDEFTPITKKTKIIQNVFNSMRRFDFIQPLLDDESVSEIMVNGLDKIIIERDGIMSQTELSFQSIEKLEQVIQSIVGKVNRVVNESVPIVDARLADGSRVNVVLPPAAINGPILTIRKFPFKQLKMDDLLRFQAINKEAAEFLESMVKERFNIFISGGTGAGKTTLLNALSEYIYNDERVITIEDSAELQIKGIKNLVRLETRNANTEGRGGINIRELIKASLRMRPDRIIIGEVRGAEALDMLQAMNTGHDGSLSTGHANSCQDMLKRLETMVLEAALIPLQAVRGQICSAIDYMVHISRLRDKSRRITEICEVGELNENGIEIRKLFEFVETGEKNGRIEGCLVRRYYAL
jgi:pilus assembly protein CpaF